MPRLIGLIVLAAVAAVSIAQPSETERRGAIPPGESRDASRPADGAIKGGSIEGDIGTNLAPERDIARCKQLTGELREQCLQDLGASAGASRAPAPIQRIR